MIGVGETRQEVAMPRGPSTDPMMRPEFRWGLGCLVAAAALIGLLVLLFVVAYLLQPPTWVQIILGLALVGGVVLLGWLVATALEQRDHPGPRPVDED